ncbi:MAG: hypothetical protein Q4G11_00930 [Gallicola sp.]|nr:hypothetical protein [Gallicola sp.]
MAKFSPIKGKSQSKRGWCSCFQKGKALLGERIAGVYKERPAYPGNLRKGHIPGGVKVLAAKVMDKDGFF